MNDPPIFALSRKSSWKEIRDWFLSGHLAGFPAEYSYALSEVPTRRPVDDSFRLFRIKKRSENKPILYLAGNLRIIDRFARIPKNPSRRCFLGKRPQFLTVLLPARSLSISLGMAHHGKVAFRIPTDPLVKEFLTYLNEPLSGTSLNLSGSAPLRSIKEIRTIFPDLALVDGGNRPGFPISPILDLTTFEHRVIRGSWKNIGTYIIR